MAHRTLEYVALSELVPATRNPKGHDIAGIRASMVRFGFVEPIIHDGRTGKMIAGHGRLETLAEAMAAGIDPPEGLGANDAGEWTVPVVFGWSSKDDPEADALLVTVNNLTTRGGWTAELGDLLSDLLDHDVDLLTVTGFNQDDVADMLAHLAGPPSLDELENRHGRPDATTLWPVLRFKVAPTVRDRYLKLVEGVEGGDDVLFDHVLTLAERP